MSPAKNGRDLLNLPTHEVELPQRDIYYHVPYNPDKDRKFNNIPFEYLEKRLDYAIGRLKERVKIATAKHLKSVRPSTMGHIDALSTRVYTAISDVFRAEKAIETKDKLDEVCAAVRGEVDKFKSLHEDSLHGSQRLAEMFLQAESNVIRDNVMLDSEGVSIPPSLNGDTQEEKDIKMLNRQMDQVLAYHERYGSMIEAVSNEKFEGAIELVMEYTESMLLMLGKFSKDEMQGIPPAVRDAIFEEINVFIQAVKEIKSCLLNALRLREIDADQTPSVEKMRAGIKMVDGAVHYREIKALQTEVAGLKERSNEVFPIAKTIDGIRERVDAVIEQTGMFFAIKEIRGALEQVFRFVDDDADLMTLFDIHSEELVGDQEEEPVNAKGLQITEDKDGMPRADCGNKRIAWKKLPEEERVFAVKEKLFQIPVLRDLANLERWLDLRLVMELMNFKDFRDLGLSITCFGSKDACYPKKEDLIKACFPEAGTIKNPRYPSTLARGRDASRFTWIDCGKEQAGAEVRKRLFGGWGLLKDLYDGKRWGDFRYIMERIKSSSLTLDFKLSQSCVGGKRAPFKTVEEMLSAVFPEVF